MRENLGAGVRFEGSESICLHCGKAYQCAAHKDDYELSLVVHGVIAKVSFKELFAVAQIKACPISKFQAVAL